MQTHFHYEKVIEVYREKNTGSQSPSSPLTVPPPLLEVAKVNVYSLRLHIHARVCMSIIIYGRAFIQGSSQAVKLFDHS